MGRVGEHIPHGPLHVRVQGGAESGVVWQARIIGGLHEAADKALSKLFFCALAGVDAEHRRMTAARLRVAGRATEHFGPVARQSLHVIGMSGVRERVVQNRVLQAPLVVRSCECQERRLAARELEDRWSRHGTYSARWSPSAARAPAGSSTEAGAGPAFTTRTLDRVPDLPADRRTKLPIYQPVG